MTYKTRNPANGPWPGLITMLTSHDQTVTIHMSYIFIFIAFVRYPATLLTLLRRCGTIFSSFFRGILLFNYQNIKYKKLRESNSSLQGSEQGQVMHWHLREGNEKESNGRECLHHFPYNGWWSSRKAAIPGEQRYIVLHMIILFLFTINLPFPLRISRLICQKLKFFVSFLKSLSCT